VSERVFLDRGTRRTVELRTAPDGSIEAVVDGRASRVRVEPSADGSLRLGEHVAWLTVTGRRTFVTLDGRDYVFEAAVARQAGAADHGQSSGEVAMPMPGLVLSVAVKAGDQVKRGQPLIVVEAMKMEHTLRAPRDGVVTRVTASPGEKADAGRVLVEIAPPTE